MTIRHTSAMKAARARRQGRTLPVGQFGGYLGSGGPFGRDSQSVNGLLMAFPEAIKPPQNRISAGGRREGFPRLETLHSA